MRIEPFPRPRMIRANFPVARTSHHMVSMAGVSIQLRASLPAIGMWVKTWLEIALNRQAIDVYDIKVGLRPKMAPRRAAAALHPAGDLAPVAAHGKLARGLGGTVPLLLPPRPPNGGEGRGERAFGGPNRIHFGQNRPGRYLTDFSMKKSSAGARMSDRAPVRWAQPPHPGPLPLSGGEGKIKKRARAKDRASPL